MKKLTVLLLTAAMALSLAACDGGHSAPDSTDRFADSPSQTPTETPAQTPTETPAQTPTETPTQTPTETPAQTPTETPTQTPTEAPVPDPILVSDPIEGEPLRYQVTGSSVYIQNLYDFMGAAMTVERPDPEDWQDEYVYYPFSGSDANVQDIEEYVNTICGGAYNLKLIDKCVKTYDTVFVSYAIDYIGTGAVTSTMEANFSQISCTLSLYYTQERGKVKGMLILPSSMEVVDMGLRQSGGSAELRLGGVSAYAGLYRMPDGSFQTDDGRLRVKPGTALVLRDGNAYTAEAQFERGEREDHLWVKNFYRDETIFFSSPVSRLMTGDLFTMRDLYDDLNWAYASAEEFDDFRHDIPFLGLGHDGKFISPKPSGKNFFQDITVRIMYWDPNVVGVYYIYAKLSSAPYEIEALVAVGLKKTEGYTGGDGEYQLAVGQSMDLTPSREYSTNYELFTWEIVDGAGTVELNNTVSATCTVKANRSGTAVIRVTYQYGVDEPDVLTGYPRNADHTRTTEFTIYID